MKKVMTIFSVFLLCAAIITTVCAYQHFSDVGLFSNERKNIKTTAKTVVDRTALLPVRDIDDIILSSDLIIAGTVKEIEESRWSDQESKSGILQTDIVININNVYYGEPSSDNVILRIDKGSDENTVVLDEWIPDFTVGEEALLFLMRDDSDLKTDEDYYVLTANEQAKYEIHADSDIAICSFEDKTIDLQGLSNTIVTLNANNPYYKQNLEAERAQISENNAKLFGE